MKYSKQELMEADIADLETDYRCAVRDGLYIYAQNIEVELEMRKRDLLEYKAEMAREALKP